MLGSRLAWLGMSVTNLFLLVGLLAVNVVVIVAVNNSNTLGIATNFGYLTMGNAMLVLVPATRNSVIYVLVSE